MKQTFMTMDCHSNEFIIVAFKPLVTDPHCRKRETNPTQMLTISWHPHRQTFLEAAMLAAVAIHTHDHAVFILHTHLVVDVLLDAAAEKTLRAPGKKSEEKGGEPTNLTCVKWVYWFSAFYSVWCQLWSIPHAFFLNVGWRYLRRQKLVCPPLDSRESTEQLASG